MIGFPTGHLQWNFVRTADCALTLPCTDSELARADDDTAPVPDEEKNRAGLPAPRHA